jgi:hypothetical protein
MNKHGKGIQMIRIDVDKRSALDNQNTSNYFDSISQTSDVFELDFLYPQFISHDKLTPIWKHK